MSATVSTRNWRKAQAPIAPLQQDLGFRRLDADLFLANQIWRHGGALITAGTSSFAERRERIRRALLAEDLDEAHVLDDPTGFSMGLDSFRAPDKQRDAFEDEP